MEFHNSYVPIPEAGCWLWERGATGAGYGCIYWNGKVELAHRVSWELMNGPIPGDLCVLHKCDTPLCVNPDHLFLGTRGDNSEDKVRKGRQHRPQGMKHNMVKLTDSQVHAIREELAKGYTQRYIAKRYGVDQSNISYIKRGKTWRHL